MVNSSLISLYPILKLMSSIFYNSWLNVLTSKMAELLTLVGIRLDVLWYVWSKETAGTIFSDSPARTVLFTVTESDVEPCHLYSLVVPLSTQTAFG